MENLYFKLDQKAAVLGYVLCYILFPGMLIGLIASNNAEPFMIVTILLIILLVIFNHIVFEINGFKIINNKLRVIAKYKIRTFKYDDIDKVEVVFNKVFNHYYIEAKVKLISSKEVKFVWDQVKSRYISYYFKVNEDNVYYYLDKLNSFDKFEAIIKN